MVDPRLDGLGSLSFCKLAHGHGLKSACLYYLVLGSCPPRGLVGRPMAYLISSKLFLPIARMSV
jgi:hypothetical protein